MVYESFRLINNCGKPASIGKDAALDWLLRPAGEEAELLICGEVFSPD